MLTTLRGWANRHTAKGRYSPVGVAFHWTMAALILFQLGWGWWVSRLPVGGEKLAGYQVHSDVGLLILVLATLRLPWRLWITDPINDADGPGWRSRVAHWTAWTFYLCFFGLPLSGWAMWSALGDGDPLLVAGVIPWPQMPFATLDREWQWAIMDWSENAHQLLIVVLVILIPLHIGAALQHHFWHRDDVLEAILPQIPDAERPREAKKHKPRSRESRSASSPG